MHLLMTGTGMTLRAWRDAGFGLQCIIGSEGSSAGVRDQAAVILHAYRLLHDVSLAV
jgi:hypothetical protein